MVDVGRDGGGGRTARRALSARWRALESNSALGHPHLSMIDFASSKQTSCRFCAAASSSPGSRGMRWDIRLSMALETRSTAMAASSPRKFVGVTVAEVAVRWCQFQTKGNSVILLRDSLESDCLDTFVGRNFKLLNESPDAL